MPYRAPVSEFRFVFDHVVGMDQVAATDTFAEATPKPWRRSCKRRASCAKPSSPR